MQSILLNVLVIVVAVVVGVVITILVIILGMISDSLAAIASILSTLLWLVMFLGIAIVWILCLIKAYGEPCTSCQSSATTLRVLRSNNTLVFQ